MTTTITDSPLERLLQVADINDPESLEALHRELSRRYQAPRDKLVIQYNGHEWDDYGHNVIVVPGHFTNDQILAVFDDVLPDEAEYPPPRTPTVTSIYWMDRIYKNPTLDKAVLLQCWVSPSTFVDFWPDDGASQPRLYRPAESDPWLPFLPFLLEQWKSRELKTVTYSDREYTEVFISGVRVYSHERENARSNWDGGVEVFESLYSRHISE